MQVLKSVGLKKDDPRLKEMLLKISMNERERVLEEPQADDYDVSLVKIDKHAFIQ